MAFDPAIIERVVDAGRKVAEQSANINYAANHEPYRRYYTNDNSNDYNRYEEIPAPPFCRPGWKEVPHKHSDERDAKLINHRIQK